jgi:hypothetical protein
MKPKETIERFDRFLDAECLRLEAVVIGGVAMALLGVTSRQTKDCDVLDPEVPSEVADAARRFAEQERAAGNPLDDGWLNNGPASLADVLPPGWRGGVRTLFEGRALHLLTLGRVDLLRSKLFALCDRALDLQDCVALRPTEEELEEILPWLVQQDANPDWPDHARATIADLRRRLGHGV